MGLDVVELLINIEAEYSVHIPDADARATVGDLHWSIAADASIAPRARAGQMRSGPGIMLLVALWLCVAACQKVQVVNDTDGRPVENAEISVITARDAKVWGRTDGGGVRWVSLPDSSEGAVTVVVCRWLFARSEVSFPSSAAIPRPLVIRLRRDSTNTAGVEAKRRCSIAH